MNDQGLGSWIRRRARMTPWKTAIIYDGKSWTYAELNNRIARLTHGLRSLGVRRGDRIGYLGNNHPAFLETMFATTALGALFVPLNVRFSSEALIHVINTAKCDIIIYRFETQSITDIIKPAVNVNKYISIENTTDDIGLESLISNQPEIAVDEYVELDDIALLCFTSGTTGMPKGVMLSHGNLTWNVFNLMSCSDFLSDDIILAHAPLYRMGGLGVTVLPGLFKGSTIVLTQEKEFRKIGQLIERHKISILFGAPDFFKSLDEAFRTKKTDLSSIRFCICGGDSVPESLIQAWFKRGIQFQQGYGLTEAAPVALLLDKQEIFSRNGSAGRPMFFTDVRVVNPDMTDVKKNQVGEIVIRGANVMKGYWIDSETTDNKITHNGWLHSGDAARIDEKGYIYIVGRMKDEIDLGDKKVYPSEIEKILTRHPDISECAVTGLQMKNRFSVVAFVVPKPGISSSANTLNAYLKEKLPKRLLPNYIQFVDALPKNPNGKIIRWKLKELPI